MCDKDFFCQKSSVMLVICAWDFRKKSSDAFFLNLHHVTLIMIKLVYRRSMVWNRSLAWSYLFLHVRYNVSRPRGIHPIFLEETLINAHFSNVWPWFESISRSSFITIDHSHLPQWGYCLICRYSISERICVSFEYSTHRCRRRRHHIHLTMHTNISCGKLVKLRVWTCLLLSSPAMVHEIYFLSLSLSTAWRETLFQQPSLTTATSPQIHLRSSSPLLHRLLSVSSFVM